MPNFTKNAIKASFWKLLKERPLSQITVKDIVEDCGINRNSFYYHYENLPALVEEIVEELLNETIKAHPTVDSFEDGLTLILSFILENKKAIYHIYNSVDHDIMEKHLLNICEYTVSKYINKALAGVALTDENKKVIINYHKCALFGQVIAWLNSGADAVVLSDVHLFCDISRTVTKTIMDIEKNKN